MQATQLQYLFLPSHMVYNRLPALVPKRRATGLCCAGLWAYGVRQSEKRVVSPAYTNQERRSLFKKRWRIIIRIKELPICERTHAAPKMRLPFKQIRAVFCSREHPNRHSSRLQRVHRQRKEQRIAAWRYQRGAGVAKGFSRFENMFSRNPTHCFY